MLKNWATLATNWREETTFYIRIGTPILGTQILQMGIGVVDVMMVGNYSSQDLAGVALGSGIWFNLMLLFCGPVFANGPIAARFFGAQRWELIGETIWVCFWIALLNSLIAMIIFLNIGPLFQWVEIQPIISDFAVDYLFIICFSAFPFIWLNGLRACCEATGYPRIITYVYIFTFILNALLNYVFIYGIAGFPQMGGLGSAVASLIVPYVSCGLIFLFLTKSELKKKLVPFKKILPNWGLIKEYYFLGMPIGLSLFIELSMFGGVALLVSKFEPSIVAGHQIALNISSLVFMLPLAISFVAAIRIGNSLGARQKNNIGEIIKYAFHMSIFIGILNFFILWLFAQWLVIPYTNEQSVMTVAIAMLFLAALFQFGDSIQVVATGVLRAFKITNFTTIAALISYWVIGLPVGYWLSFVQDRWDLEAVGLWYGMLFALYVMPIFLLIRIAYLYYKQFLKSPEVYFSIE